MSESSPREGQAATPSTELVEASAAHVIAPAAAADVVAAMTAYQDLLPQLLTDDDYQNADDKRFVKKSGWRKIAKAFGLSVELLGAPVIDRDPMGRPIRARVVARATHPPTGQFSDGDGYCSIDEQRFSGGRSEQALKKAENDLPATATTRAKNRAISDLVGMGEVSAEEVDAGDGNGSSASLRPPTAKQSGDAKRALAYLLNGGHEGSIPDPVAAIALSVWQRSAKDAKAESPPAVVCKAWIDTARGLRKAIRAGDSAPAEPDQDTPAGEAAPEPGPEPAAEQPSAQDAERAAAVAEAELERGVDETGHLLEGEVQDGEQVEPLPDEPPPPDALTDDDDLPF